MPTRVMRLIPTVLAISFLGLAQPSYAEHNHSSTIPGATKTIETDAALRDLWLDHVFWVRNVTISMLSGNTASTVAAEKEVVANAKLIASATEPFYGKSASEKLFTLLAGHYGAVKKYIEATDTNHQKGQEQALSELTANASEIAAFLSGANPNLPYAALNSLLISHGGHHIQQIQQLKAEQYGEEAQTWAAMKNHMYVIADALTGALTKQFPAKF